MITKGGLFHQPKSNYSYGYDRDTLHIRFRALKGEVKKASLVIGDPFIWERGGAGGNLEARDAAGWKSEVLVMEKEVTTEYHDYFFVSVKGETKRSRYAFILEDEDEKILFGERRIVDLSVSENKYALSELANFYCFPYLNGIDVFMAPKWAKDMVWYQIFPDRFNNGDKGNDPVGTNPWNAEPTGTSFSGGDIQGVMDKLDYLKELGITGIHFCPLFEGDTNHKYMTNDYKKIDPIFGTNKLFKSFVKKAHEKGIKVMLDAVFNHVGINHPFFQDVIEKGEESKYKDWFSIKSLPIKRGSYETFATIDDMPRVNMECEEAKEYFIEVGKYWIEEYGIDGWRLDVANEVTHDFWKCFRSELKKIKPDALIVGEVWHDATPWIAGDQYDAVMHYPLTDACLRYFAKRVADKDEFIAVTNRLLVHYPKNVIENSYNILNSHDTSRFLYDAGQDVNKLLLAYVFIFTHPGSPSLYYGDEIGLSGEKGMNKELHRRTMKWDENQWNKWLHGEMKTLIALRKEIEDFKEVSVKWLETNNDKVLAYKRGKATVFINMSDEKVKVPLNGATLKYVIGESNADDMVISSMGYGILLAK